MAARSTVAVERLTDSRLRREWSAGSKVGEQVRGHDDRPSSPPRGQAVQVRCQGCRCQRAQSTGERSSDRTSQHIAGAGCRQSSITRGDESDLAAWVGNDGGRPLQEHDRVEVAGSSADCIDAVRARAIPSEPFELAIVGREHDWPSCNDARITGNNIDRAGVQHCRRTETEDIGKICNIGRRIEPWSDDERAVPAAERTDDAAPALLRKGNAHRLTMTDRSSTRGRYGDVPCAASSRRLCREREGPGHAGLPSDHPNSPLPLVSEPHRSWPEPEVGIGDQLHRPNADIESDVGNLDHTGMIRTGPEEQAGLSCSERDGHIGSHGLTPHLSGQTVDAGRDVDRKYHRGVDARSSERSSEPRADTTVDHQVGGVPWGLVRRQHLATHSSTLENRRRHSTIGPIVSRTDEDRDPAAVPTSEHPKRDVGNSVSCPFDQLRRRLSSLGIDDCHFRRCDDRIHPGILPAAARSCSEHQIECLAELPRFEVHTAHHGQANDDGLGSAPGQDL